MAKLDSKIKIDNTEYEVVAAQVANTLTVKMGDTTLAEFDGSTPKTVDIPEDTYSNSTPTVNALGGIASGTTFDKMPITAVLDKLLYPYVAPVMGSTVVSRDPSRTVLEYGETQIISGLKVSVQKKSDPITSIKLIAYDSYVGESIEEEKTGDSIKNGGVEIPFTKTFTIGTKINNKFYNPALKFRATDGTTTVDSSSISTAFVYPYYHGAVNADAVVSENIIKNLKKEVVQKGDKTWAFTLNNQKAVFAYPKSYGALKSIINQNNYEVINTFTRSELSITGLDGTAQTYYVYVSNGASTISDFKYTFDI